MPTATDGGRRERKKLATRAALRRAALRLAVRDGIENVTVERIADEADVALRTFFNYFSGKEEAVLATAALGAEEVVARFRARPPAESVLEALRVAVLEVVESDDVAGHEHLAVLRLIRAAPSLLPQQLSVPAAQEQALAAAIADRVGLPADDAYPRLCATAAFAALRVTLDRWLARTAADWRGPAGRRAARGVRRRNGHPRRGPGPGRRRALTGPPAAPGGTTTRPGGTAARSPCFAGRVVPVSARSGTDDPARRRRPSPALAAGVVLGLLGPAAVFVLLAALTAVIPGATLLGATLSPVVVTVHGLQLVVLGLVTAVVAWLLRRAHPRVATVVTAVAALGTLALAGAVGAVVAATVGAGGGVAPLRATALTGGTGGGPPDERPVYLTTPSGQDLHLAVTRPRGAAGPAPVLVWVHGGGWATGSELDRAEDARRLAGEGWLVVSVEYTLSAPGRPTWDVAGPQVACALSRVTEHADEYGGDPGRIVLAGDSAGGQLATSVGYRAAAGTQASACASPVPVPVPRAIATLYPAVDLADTYHRGEGARGFAVAYTGGTPDQVPDRYRAVSGADAVTPAAPPTLSVVPTRDRLVPPGGAERFVEVARAAGVDAEQVDIPFADHAFDVGPAGSLGHQAATSVLEHWAAEQVGG
ncbi:MAG TPA: alpha/beta hydrolase fold domain-containing protein [Actinomycetospora sp.]|nr:alpha/beta hydrolase fold domain-containing protein [Actinomycetospora sp.]